MAPADYIPNPLTTQGRRPDEDRATRQQNKTTIFFPSGMADHALRLGPDKSISNINKFHMDTIGPMQCGKHDKKEQKNTKNKATRTSPGQICESPFRKPTKQTAKGAGPNKNTHTKRNATMTQRYQPLCQ